MSLYKDSIVPTPANGRDEDFHKLPKILAQDKNEGRVRWHWRFDTPQRYQEYMKNYYRLATEVDATCGVVIEELKRQGVLNNTLVIFTTDNGYYHGEHGLADKWYPHEESIRVPLVICDPRIPASARGQVRDEMTLNADLAPTILAATETRAPSTMQGRDVSPLYLSPNKTQDWRTEYFYEHGTISNIERIPSSEALVRKDIKYMYWPDYNVEQLFDLTVDPHENNDIIHDSKYSDRLTELRTRFAALKAAAK